MAISSLRAKFAKQAGALKERHQAQQETQDMGGTFSSVFKKSEIPEGIQFWKCGKGEHLVDIIPFFSGSQNPTPDSDPAKKVPEEEGAPSYLVDFWMHRNIGPMSKQYVCQKNTWGMPCPICNYQQKYGGTLSDPDRKALSPTRRCAYLVWVHDDDKQESKGLQLWEVSHFLMEKNLDATAKLPKGGGHVAFYDVDNGRQVVFERVEKGSGRDMKVDMLGFKLIEREPIPEEILAQSFALDMAIDMFPDMDEITSTIEEMIAGTSPDKTASSKASSGAGEKKYTRPIDKEPEEEDIPDTKNLKGGKAQEEDEQEPEPDLNSECPYEGGTFGETFSIFEECIECDFAQGCEFLTEQKKEKKKPTPTKKQEPTKKPEPPKAGSKFRNR